MTTDFILDETATLLKARDYGHVLQGYFNSVTESSACEVEWTDPQRFRETTGVVLSIWITPGHTPIA